MEEQVMRRGEIYHADLNPVFGSEQGGYRPVLIIQNNRGNQHSPTVIVAAITSHGYCCGYYEPAKDQTADTCTNKWDQRSGERVFRAVGADPDSG